MARFFSVSEMTKKKVAGPTGTEMASATCRTTFGGASGMAGTAVRRPANLLLSTVVERPGLTAVTQRQTVSIFSDHAQQIQQLCADYGPPNIR